MQTSPVAYRWDDNPTSLDLLGYRDVVSPIADALLDPELDPLTVGIHSPWGGGKTTALELLAGELEDREDTYVVVVRLSPWEFDGAADVRGEVIRQVLDTLACHQRWGAQFQSRAKGLLARVSWSRLASVAARGALLQAEALKDGLAELRSILTPPPGDDDRPSMRDFKREFEAMLAEVTEVNRVVVLVDDLDRCLPPAVVQTFEAIKLFLAVKGIAFVLAADTQMITRAVQATLAGDPSDGDFARRYVEKIVQLPVSLPHLSHVELESYLTLLLASKDPRVSEVDDLIGYCEKRRRDQQHPYAEGFDGIQPHVDLARQLSNGLRADRYGSPREVKRFLNALGVRLALAEARNVHLQEPVIAKLYLLETQHPQDFVTFLATDPATMTEVMKRWESWAQSDKDEPSPEGFSDASRSWARSTPSLVDSNIDLGRYLTFAVNIAHGQLELLRRLSPHAIAIANELADRSAAVNERGTQRLKDAHAGIRQQVIEALRERARDESTRDGALIALIQVAGCRDELRDQARELVLFQYPSNLTSEHLSLIQTEGLHEWLKHLRQHGPREVRDAARDMHVRS